LEQAMVGTRRLENHSGDIGPFEPVDEGAMAISIVRDAKALAARMDRHVESVFRNVDATGKLAETDRCDAHACLRGHGKSRKPGKVAIVAI